MPHKKFILFVNIAEIVVKLVTDCEFEDEKLRRLFEHHIIAEGDADIKPDHTVSFIPVLQPVSPPADAVKHWKGTHVACFQDSEPITWFKSEITGLDYIYVSRLICIVNDFSAKRTTVCILCKQEKDGKLSRPDFLDAIFIMVHLIGAVHNRFTTHAAAVKINGKAKLLLGRSGSGKSTLSTDLTKLGAHFMGDDVVFLYRKDDTPMIGSLMFEAKLFPKNTKKRKDMVNIIRDCDCPTTICAPLESIHIIRQTKCNESWLEPLHPAECLAELIQGTNDVHMLYDAREWQEVCQLMAEKAPYSVFHFGNRDKLSLSAFSTYAQQ